MNNPLRAYVGVGRGPDAGRAAREAVEAALKRNAKPALALVFATHTLDQEQVGSAARESLGGVPFIGGSTFAEMSPEGYRSDSVVVMTLDGPFRFGSANASLGADPLAAARDVTERAKAALGGHKADLALCFVSGETGNGAAVARAIGMSLDPGTLMFGGACGCRNDDPARMGPSHTYGDGTLTRDGVVLLLLSFTAEGVRISSASGHGMQPISVPMTVDRADAQFVYEVAGQNVLDFYEKFMGKAIEEVGPYIFTYPFLAHRDRGETAAQVPLVIDREQRRIGFFPVPPRQGQAVSLAHATREQILRACREAAYRAKIALGNQRPALVLLVSCEARRMILGTRTGEELEIVGEVFGKDVPVAGLYSAMEIAPFKPGDGAEGGEGGWRSSAVAETFCILAIGHGAVEDPVSHHSGRIVAGKLPPEEELARARVEIEELRKRMIASDALLDFREQVLMKTIQENIEMTRELQAVNLGLSELNRRNQQLLRMIRQYTPQTTWRKAGKLVDEGRLEIPDEQADLTYLFLDVMGFTKFSETHPPEKVIDSLNALFRPAVDAIADSGGDINKFIGDALFATFDDPADAVRAGLEICRRVARVETVFKVRIGINRGRSIHGNVGSDQRKDNTLIGDAVNLAQRLESACTPGRVLISQGVHEMVKFTLELKGSPREITVKGKSEPVRVFEVEP
jgi:class 3 adenylate cyclase